MKKWRHFLRYEIVGFWTTKQATQNLFSFICRLFHREREVSGGGDEQRRKSKKSSRSQVSVVPLCSSTSPQDSNLTTSPQAKAREFWAVHCNSCHVEMIRTVSITETRHNLQDAKKDDKIIHGKIVGVVALTLFCDYFLLTLVIPSKWKDRNIPITSLACISLYLCFSLTSLWYHADLRTHICSTVFPELFGDSFSSFQIGILFAAKPFFQFFFNPLIGAQVDRVGPVYPLLFGTLVLALATMVVSLYYVHIFKT